MATERNSVARQQRMRALIEAENDKNEDTFGMNDDDWNVYLVNQSEEDAEEEVIELQEIESLLSKHDKSSNGHNTPATVPSLDTFHESDYQLYLSVERIRAPEIVFQPLALCGLDQMGIPEVLYHTFRQFSLSEQTSMAKVKILWYCLTPCSMYSSQEGTLCTHILRNVFGMNCGVFVRGKRCLMCGSPMMEYMILGKALPKLL